MSRHSFECPTDSRQPRLLSVWPIHGLHRLPSFPQAHDRIIPLTGYLSSIQEQRLSLCSFGAHHVAALGYFSCSVFHAFRGQWSLFFSFRARLISEGLSIDTFGLCADWASRQLTMCRRVGGVDYNVGAYLELHDPDLPSSFHLRDVRHLPYPAFSMSAGRVGLYVLSRTGLLNHEFRGSSETLGRLPSVYQSSSVLPSQATLSCPPIILYLPEVHAVVLIGIFGLHLFDLAKLGWTRLRYSPSEPSHSVPAPSTPSAALISGAQFLLKPSFELGTVHFVSVRARGPSWTCVCTLGHADLGRGDIVITGTPNVFGTLLLSGYARQVSLYYSIPLLSFDVISILDVYYREELVHCISLGAHTAIYVSDL